MYICFPWVFTTLYIWLEVVCGYILDLHQEGHKRRDVPEKISAGLKVQHFILEVMFPQFPYIHKTERSHENLKKLCPGGP